MHALLLGLGPVALLECCAVIPFGAWLLMTLGFRKRRIPPRLDVESRHLEDKEGGNA